MSFFELHESRRYTPSELISFFVRQRLPTNASNFGDVFEEEAQSPIFDPNKYERIHVNPRQTPIRTYVRKEEEHATVEITEQDDWLQCGMKLFSDLKNKAESAGQETTELTEQLNRELEQNEEANRALSELTNKNMEKTREIAALRERNSWLESQYRSAKANLEKYRSVIENVKRCMKKVDELEQKARWI